MFPSAKADIWSGKRSPGYEGFFRHLDFETGDLHLVISDEQLLVPLTFTVNALVMSEWDIEIEEFTTMISRLVMMTAMKR